MIATVRFLCSNSTVISNASKKITTSGNILTEKLGLKMGLKLKGGETIELVSDLGGGKTTFVRGVAQGFGSRDKVASPSFTISRVYTSGAKQMHHFDFYRLTEAGIMKQELAEILGDPQTVVVIEWADAVKDVLPKERLTVHIKTVGENERDFTFTYPPSLGYLMGGIS